MRSIRVIVNLAQLSAMKANLKRSIGSIPIWVLIGLHLFIGFSVVSCAHQGPEAQRKPALESKFKRSSAKRVSAESVAVDPENSTGKDRQTIEAVLKELEAIRSELAKVQEEKAQIESSTGAISESEMEKIVTYVEKLETENRELQQILLSMDGSSSRPNLTIAQPSLPTEASRKPQTEELHVLISGALPNPEGNERLHEAIELLNLGADPVSLEGWVIKDLANSQWELDSLGELEGGGSKIQTRDTMNMGLNNDGDTVRLIAPDGRVVDTFTYEETVEGVWIRREIK